MLAETMRRIYYDETTFRHRADRGPDQGARATKRSGARMAGRDLVSDLVVTAMARGDSNSMNAHPTPEVGQAGCKLVGQSVPRNGGSCAADRNGAPSSTTFRLPGHAVRPRSCAAPRPHARIRVNVRQGGRHAGRARCHDGPRPRRKGQAVGADLMQDLLVGDHFPFAIDKVTFEGQESRGKSSPTRSTRALDALEAIVVEYDELPVLV